MSGMDDYLGKAREAAKDNPDQARSVIDKVEDFVDEKTGGKYKDAVDKAGDWIEGQLGLPNTTNNPAPDAQQPSEPATPSEPVQPPVDPSLPQDPLPTDPPVGEGSPESTTETDGGVTGER